jgi:hypothetical protein
MAAAPCMGCITHLNGCSKEVSYDSPNDGMPILASRYCCHQHHQIHNKRPGPPQQQAGHAHGTQGAEQHARGRQQLLALSKPVVQALLGIFFILQEPRGISATPGFSAAGKAGAVADTSTPRPKQRQHGQVSKAVMAAACQCQAKECLRMQL